jgi:hypothetical protein
VHVALASQAVTAVGQFVRVHCAHACETASDPESVPASIIPEEPASPLEVAPELPPLFAPLFEPPLVPVLAPLALPPLVPLPPEAPAFAPADVPEPPRPLDPAEADEPLDPLAVTDPAAAPVPVALPETPEPVVLPAAPATMTPLLPAAALAWLPEADEPAPAEAPVVAVPAEPRSWEVEPPHPKATSKPRAAAPRGHAKRFMTHGFGTCMISAPRGDPSPFADAIASTAATGCVTSSSQPPC